MTNETMTKENVTDKDLTVQSAAKKNTNVIPLILNGFLVLFGLIGLWLSLKSGGLEMVKFYTQDSNVLGLLSSILFVAFGILSFVKGQNGEVPVFVTMFRYVASSCMLVTFIVVVTILTPMYGFQYFGWLLFKGSNLWYHTVCPLLSLVTFLCFEPGQIRGFSKTLIALIPTVIYAAVTITLNAVNLLEGPYPFLYVHKQPIYMSVFWVVLIVGGAYGLAVLLYFLRKKLHVTKQ